MIIYLRTMRLIEHFVYSFLILFWISVPALADYVSLDQMLKDLSEPPLLEIKQHYIGSRIHYNNGSFNFHCKKLFSNSSDALGPVWPPPLSLPEQFIDSYTLDRKIPVIFNKINTYWSEKQLDGDGYSWDADLIDNYESRRDGVPNGAATFCYGNSCCADVIAKYKSSITDKVGMVIGTQHPWAEAMLVKAGAKYVTTVEYMRINSKHPKVGALTPQQLADNAREGNFSLVDFVFTYSSLEHDGLGRYGDPMNPFADLESIARIHCILKPGAMLFLGFPTGPDSIIYNSQRVYGKLRLSLILPMWEIIGRYY
jgi:Caenorhabditis protein of unknown function, DUF268